MRNKLNSKMFLPTIIATLHDNLHRTKEQFHSFLQRMAVTDINCNGESDYKKARKYT